MSTHVLRAAALVAALAAALWPAAWAAAAPLSLDQALDLAVQRSQAVRSARAGAQGAAEMARAAGQLPDPMLFAGIDNLPASGPNRFSTGAEDMTMRRAGISQEWVGAAKRAAREAVAHAMADREAAAERVAAAEARLQTALAFIDAYYAGEAVKLASVSEQHAREDLAAGKGRQAAAAGSSAEVLGLAGALGSAEDASADLRQLQAAAAAGLQRWTGASADELAMPPSAAADAPGQGDFVAGHPAVVARQRDIEVARQELEVVRLNRRPNWTYELSYGQRQGRPDMVSFGVSIPLPVAPESRQDRERAARTALLDKAQAELEEARRAAAGEYAALSGDAMRLQARIQRYESGVIEPLGQRTVATLAAYRANQASLAMVFEARYAELEARRKLLDLQRDLARTRAQLIFKPIVQGAAQ
jgi:cobalt-zinc-cadmium efflux system outer membrane protein